jgi:hypothetical protein
MNNIIQLPLMTAQPVEINGAMVRAAAIVQQTRLYQQSQPESSILLAKECPGDSTRPATVLGVCQEVFVGAITIQSLFHWKLPVKKKWQLVGQEALIANIRVRSPILFGVFSTGIYSGDDAFKYSIRNIMLAMDGSSEYFPGAELPITLVR